MRSVSIVLALAMVMALALVILPSPTRALDPPKLSITIEAGVGSDFRFNPATIVLPSVPIILNVTLVNNQTGPGQQNTQHTFSIRDSSKAKHIEIWVNTTRARASAEFAVNSTTQMSVRGVLFTAETALAGGFLFFCSPHEAVGMVGNIVIGGVAQRPSPEIGVFLRAYWIGIIGLVAMLVWTGITYFIIKASSRHSADHRDHIRRGLT